MNDEPCVAFMNPVTAVELLDGDSEIADAIVASKVIPETDVVVVRKEDFLKWLYEDAERLEREDEKR